MPDRCNTEPDRKPNTGRKLKLKGKKSEHRRRSKIKGRALENKMNRKCGMRIKGRKKYSKVKQKLTEPRSRFPMIKIKIWLLLGSISI